MASVHLLTFNSSDSAICVIPFIFLNSLNRSGNTFTTPCHMNITPCENCQVLKIVHTFSEKKT